MVKSLKSKTGSPAVHGQPQQQPHVHPSLRSVPPPNSDSNSGGDEQSHSSSNFSIHLSSPFLFSTVCIPISIAFAVGWVARLILLSRFGLYPHDYDYAIMSTGNTANYYYQEHANNNNSENNDDDALFHQYPSISMSKKNTDVSIYSDVSDKTTMSGKRRSRQLPAPKVIEGKDVPFTTYASKTFQMAGAATSHTLHIDRTTAMIMSRSKKEFHGGPDFQDETYNNNEEDDGWVPCESNSCSRGKEKKVMHGSEVTKAQPGTNKNIGDDSLHNDDSDGLHLPAGQHLLVDIKDVDSNFLNSEERLATAMIELINESKLTLLSYHCHSLVPIGVSCAGVLLESHVAFHTWPLEGVITMDLFTCGGGLLIPTLPSIEKLFGVPIEGRDNDTDEGGVPKPTMLWSHKLRGFREGFAPGYVRSTNPLDGSMGRYVLGKLDFDIKHPLLSTTTAHQSVNIYEVMEPTSRNVNSYQKSLLPNISNGETENSYESLHPEHFRPDKVLFFDGILQSTLFGDASYHESLVHPAMITHSNPKRVAIISGGEGAALREVLKYRSVEEVVVLEIDEELINICNQYMPEWPDCSDIEGSDVTNCFDDSRVSMVFGDAIQWFVNNFADQVESTVDGKKFDVIIMDELDTGGLYNNVPFVKSLFNGLNADGMFAAQIGKSKVISDPPDGIGRFRDIGVMIKALEQSGFESIHSYDEGHSRFYMPWSYLVALKNYKSRADWYRSEPEISIAIQKGLHRSKSGKPSLRYFDATTMINYQMPSKALESTYCRGEEHQSKCDKSIGALFDLSSFQVNKSSVEENAGRGLFADRDTPFISALSLKTASNSFLISPLTYSSLVSLFENSHNVSFFNNKVSKVYTFVEGYGVSTMLLGEPNVVIVSSVEMLANRGCNGLESDYDDGEKVVTEANFDVRSSTDLCNHLLIKAPAYCPVYERNLWRLSIRGGCCVLSVTSGTERRFSLIA